MNSESNDSGDDRLALALRSLRFITLFASYAATPFLMKQHHSARSCDVCSHDLFGIIKSFSEASRRVYEVFLLATVVVLSILKLSVEYCERNV